VPKSRTRRRWLFTPPKRRERLPTGLAGGRWVAPTMVALLLLGLAWIVVYYLAGQSVPGMQDLGGWNLLVGMGLITAGFIVATKWK
jgi:hypothetical protein